MPMVYVTSKGDFSKTFSFLNKNKYLQRKYTKMLDKYGQMGVEALREATPVDTGLTADSWSYKVDVYDGSATITWLNSNTNNSRSIPIVMLIQHGHATRNGGWVQGIDFINPALQPIFDNIANHAWEEVTKV